MYMYIIYIIYIKGTNEHFSTASCEGDYMEFWGKITSSGAYAPLCHTDFIFIQCNLF